MEYDLEERFVEKNFKPQVLGFEKPIRVDSSRVEQFSRRTHTTEGSDDLLSYHWITLGFAGRRWISNKNRFICDYGVWERGHPFLEANIIS